MFLNYEQAAMIRLIKISMQLLSASFFFFFPSQGKITNHFFIKHFFLLWSLYIIIICFEAFMLQFLPTNGYLKNPEIHFI